jgi:hypothetical protein
MVVPVGPDAEDAARWWQAYQPRPFRCELAWYG